MSSSGLRKTRAFTDELLSLSVVVCTFNRESTLRDVLSDLLSQDYPACEILVVDQSSGHDPETVAFFDRVSSRVTVVERDEPNLPAARNEGLRRARGEVVVFVDDDLRLPRHTLRAIAMEFRDPGVNGIAPRVVPDDDPGSARVFSSVEWQTLEAARHRVSNVIGACMAFRRHDLVAIGGFDEFLGRLNASASGEDMELCRRFVRAGFRLWLSSAYAVLHHGRTPGGCEVRVGRYAGSSRHHEAAATYIILKEEGAFQRLNLRAAVRLIRLFVFNRAVLRKPYLFQKLRSVREHLVFVRDRVAAAGDGNR